MAEETVWKQWLEERLLQIEHLVTSGEMAGEVAHQINNSLEGIKNYLYLLRQDFPQIDQSSSIQIVEEEVSRIAELARQLASFHRQSRAPRAPVPVRTILEGVLKLLSSRLRRFGIQVQWDDFDPAFSTTAVQELTQIFYNLLVNAIESSSSGGRIRLAAQRHSDRLEILMHDEGRGIAPEDLERVFEPFFSSKPQGLGLGLPVCKSLAERIEAKLELESRPGVGTAVAIHLNGDAGAQREGGGHPPTERGGSQTHPY